MGNKLDDTEKRAIEILFCCLKCQRFDLNLDCPHCFLIKVEKMNDYLRNCENARVFNAKWNRVQTEMLQREIEDLKAQLKKEKKENGLR